MSDAPDHTLDAEALAGIQQLYASQSHWIDNGHAQAWAHTFTEDGQFHSPSYPEPVVGTAALTAFAERFHTEARAAGETRRHVVSNIYAEPATPTASASTPDSTATVRAYLQLVTTPVGGEPRLLRLTTLTDTVVRSGGQWRVHRRVVRRDDEPH